MTFCGGFGLYNDCRMKGPCVAFTYRRWLANNYKTLWILYWDKMAIVEIHTDFTESQDPKKFCFLLF